MQTLLKHSYEKITSRFDGGGTSILMLHVCASKCWFINTSALAGALREHNADEEDRVICIIIIINIIMLLNVLMVNTAVVEMGVCNSRGEEQRHSSICFLIWVFGFWVFQLCSHRKLILLFQFLAINININIKTNRYFFINK